MHRHLTASRSVLALAACTALLSACGGGGDGMPVAEETRAHDARIFTADATQTTFAPMAAVAGDTTDMSTTSRWAGVLGGAGYRVEVPPNWNGKLVMYAHGYAGTGAAVNVQNPAIRRFLIQNGYAWAASSYSKNYYDVRVGVEDTNALALDFNKIAMANGRPLAAPTRTYITGVSMGGHITAAAIDAEAQATARNKVTYHGAVPMCGVLGDTELFNQFTAMQLTAQALAGVPSYPVEKWPEIKTLVENTLFTKPLTTPTATGQKYLSVLKNITGGERPMFDLGITNGGSFPSAWGTFGSDGTVTGVLNKNMLDTTGYTYTIDGDASGTAALNASVQKLTGNPEANRLRSDGMRWVPKTNGDIKIPVVSIHTLGDLFVPFSMEQVYQKRVAAKGNSGWLVQRAIRGISHCDFTIAEMTRAFDDMVKWERDGIKPAGDDVVTASVVASPSYGCTYTNNTIGADDGNTVKALRPVIAANTAACPAP